MADLPKVVIACCVMKSLIKLYIILMLCHNNALYYVSEINYLCLCLCLTWLFNSVNLCTVTQEMLHELCILLMWNYGMFLVALPQAGRMGTNGPVLGWAPPTGINSPGHSSRQYCTPYWIQAKLS